MLPTRPAGNDVHQSLDVFGGNIIYHENMSPTGERVIDLFFATPVSAKESLRFMVVARNFALEEPDDASVYYRRQMKPQGFTIA